MRPHVEIGKHYGNLMPIEKLPYELDSKGRQLLYYKCICDCGNETKVRSNNLLSGNTTSCGCQSSRYKKTRKLDLTGQKFGKLTAIKPIDSKRWECLCDCGNKCNVWTVSLRSGNTKSCGCYQKERAIEANLIDLSGQRFGKLTVLQWISDKQQTRNRRKTFYKCKCDCGNECVVDASSLRNGDTKSCGCLHSWGEHLVEIELKKYDVEYFKGYSFDDLVGPGNGVLIFDFCIKLKDGSICLIEYQGIQHYVDLDFGRPQREITDKLKKKYCQSKHYPLYEIKYNEDIATIVANIMNAIHANTVPSMQNIA